MERELKRLEKLGILYMVTHNTHCAYHEGRLCMATIMLRYGSTHYPSPSPDLFANGWVFTKFRISLRRTNRCMLSDEESRQYMYVTINTYLGLYQYTTLYFALTSALAMFDIIRFTKGHLLHWMTFWVWNIS